MRIQGNMLKWGLVAVLLYAPLSAWAFYKPVRALTPRLVGLTCLRSRICLDDPSYVTEAARRFDDALEFVDSTISRIKDPPRIIFCTTDSCYRTFGPDKPTAHSTPFGIIISPRGWKPPYIRHEMIHHLQKERLALWKFGPIERWRSPDWFIEGMAYSLSKDPRSVLAEPYQSYRSHFDEWYRAVGKEHLWEKARSL